MSTEAGHAVQGPTARTRWRWGGRAFASRHCRVFAIRDVSEVLDATAISESYTNPPPTDDSEYCEAKKARKLDQSPIVNSGHATVIDTAGDRSEGRLARPQDATNASARCLDGGLTFPCPLVCRSTRTRFRVADRPWWRSRKGWKQPLTWNLGAGKESRTPDLNLGKVALYQLSYSRFEARNYRRSACSRQREPCPMGFESERGA